MILDERLKQRLKLLQESNQIDERTKNATLDVFNFFYEILGLECDSENGEMFATHMALALQRIFDGVPFEDKLDDETSLEIRSKYEYRIARKTAEFLHSTYNINVPETEIDFIAAHLHIDLKKAIENISLESYPLKTISVEEAKKKQFRLVDLMHRHFRGYEALEAGDYGVYAGLGRPRRTAAVESVIAEFFNAPDACLVRGAGTGAIRSICTALLKPGDRVVIHDAPIYFTTNTTLQASGADIIKVDMNNLAAVKKAITPETKMVFIQRSRQQMTDSYDVADVIQAVKEISKEPKIVVDENYTVLKVDKLGCEYGADISTFSMFKLLGLPGIGCVVGNKDTINAIREQNYSGGGQVQGPEAMEVLRSLVLVPVIFAVQGEVVQEVVQRLNNGEVEGVAKAVEANLEERIILIQFDEPIAKDVLQEAEKFGALPHPVGSDSRYEVQSLFYCVSKTMLDKYPVIGSYVIRVNPMRAGADTVIRILKEALRRVKGK